MRYGLMKANDAKKYVENKTHIILCVTNIETQESQDPMFISSEEAEGIIDKAKTIVLTDTETIRQIQCYSETQENIYNIVDIGFVSALLTNI